MIGFYVMRGHDHERLINLSEIERAAYHLWMQQHFEDEEKRMKALFGSK